MPSLRLLVLALVCAATPLLAAPRAHGRAEGRVLDGLDTDRIGSDYVLRIRFSVPIVYLRHAPQEEGETVDIQLAPLAGRVDEEPLRESVGVPHDFPMPVEEVTLRTTGRSEPEVEVRFSRPVRFAIEPGKDRRSLLVRVPEASVLRGGRPLPSSRQGRVAPPQSAAPPSRSTQLAQEGRRAMTAGEYDRAVALFEKILELPEDAETPDALELLALARERKGQLAHAKAEYEAYLERYPEGPAAERVRQRLETLVTARKEPKVPPQRERPPRRRLLDIEAFGSAYVGYRYDGRTTDETAGITTDSSVFTDLYAQSRLRLPTWSLGTQMTGGYRHRFLDSGSDDVRISSLFFEAEHSEVGVSGSIGRRSRSSGGVLGRYDGAEVTARLGRLWELGAIGGLPVDSSRDGFGSFQRYFGGLNAKLGPLFGLLDLELFSIAQVDGGFLDRAAVGTEIRYFDRGRSLAAFVDYDVYYLSLNLAQLVGTWQAGDGTYLSVYLDYRNVPTLTTRNALQGQTVDDLEDLLDTLSREEIRDLARGRTARATTLSFSASRNLDARYQLGFDFSATDLSGLEASPGVEATQGTGFEFNYNAQLIMNGVLAPGSVAIAGLRYFDGSRVDIAGLNLLWRYPLTRGLRVTPRVRADYRLDSTAPDSLLLSPSLRWDYKFLTFNLDSEAGLRWSTPFSGDTGRDIDYFASIGLRYDY